ncbi:MAG: hypothetical protein AB8B86_11815 [Pseudomonadales bacterium]
MHDYSWAFIAAGCIGACVAIAHGVLTHKNIVQPILAGADYPQVVQRLLPALMQFSTFCWFLGGVALIATPLFPDRSSVITTAVFVGVFYAFGAAGNFWGTRGRHFGWVLLAIATALIVWGAWALIKDISLK